MYGSDLRDFTGGGAALKNAVLGYLVTNFCDKYNVGLSVAKSGVSAGSTESYYWMEHDAANVTILLSAITNGDGANIKSGFLPKGNTGTAFINNYTSAFKQSNFNYEHAILSTCITYSIYDSNNFIITLSINDKTMLCNNGMSFGILESDAGMCALYLDSIYQNICYDANVSSGFYHMAYLLNPGLNNASIILPPAQAIIAPVYYCNGTSAYPAITTDPIKHLLQAKIPGMAQGSLYKINNKEYICINAANGLLMEVKR